MSITAIGLAHCREVGVYQDGRLIKMISAGEALKLSESLREAASQITPPVSSVKADSAKPTAGQRLRKMLNLPACVPANHFNVLCDRDIGGAK